MKEKTEKCMICISTRQNTANLIPFLQFDFDLMIMLNTDHAQKEKWSEGLKQVLDERGKKIKIYPIGSGLDLVDMLQRIRGIVAQNAAVCWNIGGGQKMQQMAMIRVFEERLNKDRQDWACYADPSTKKIYKINGDKHNLKSSEFVIDTAITLNEILTIFQLKKRQSNKDILLWNRTGAESQAVAQFRDSSYFWDRDKRHGLLEAVIDNDKDQPEILKGLKHDYADYFEQIVQSEIIKILRAHAPGHHITEAWGNVRVKDKDNKEIAEWDVVLVTDFGTLIILDAKTGIFKSKDEDARLFNLEKATGFYGKFWLIIPYLFEDMDSETFTAKFGKKAKEMIRHPLDLNALNSNVLAITGQNKTLYIQKLRKNKAKVNIKRAKETDVALNDISTILNVLKLKKETSDDKTLRS